VAIGGTAAYDGQEEGLPPLVRAAVEAARAVGFENSCLPSHGRLLHVLAGGVGEGVIGETGTGAGVGLAWMASGARRGVRLVGIERDDERATVASALFADVPAVSVRHGDWLELASECPFSLLALDGGGQGKGQDWPVDPLLWLRPGGVVVMDDFTPATQWPPQFAGKTDHARLFWFEHPEMFGHRDHYGARSVLGGRCPTTFLRPSSSHRGPVSTRGSAWLGSSRKPHFRRLGRVLALNPTFFGRT
jgi:predicted O-methyltransferase YrrM